MVGKIIVINTLNPRFNGQMHADPCPLFENPVLYICNMKVHYVHMYDVVHYI